MGIHIFGQEAETVMVAGRRMKLVDVDKSTCQLEVIGQGGKRWISYNEATFNGRSFKNTDIRLPELSGSEKKKRAERLSATQDASAGSAAA